MWATWTPSATGDFAKEFVEAMWLMLQQEEFLDDYVIATGETHSIREFLDLAFGRYEDRLEKARRNRSALLSPGGAWIF